MLVLLARRGGTARSVHLADAHRPRSKPPLTSAVAANPADPANPVEDYEH